MLAHSPVNLLRRPLLSFEVHDPRTPLHRRAMSALDGQRLDRALAAGVGPDVRPALAARAATLQSRRRRRSLASGLERAVASAEHGRPPLSPQVPVASTDVRAASPWLDALAERLRAPDPCEVAGIAKVSLLLSDPLSPLYVPETREALAAAAQDALESLTGSSCASRAS
jgi:hypothetical protein